MPSPASPATRGISACSSTFSGKTSSSRGRRCGPCPSSPVSYVGWHPDTPFDQPQQIKVQIYVDDVAADGGPFAFVPGSHKPGSGPCELSGGLETMPGHKVFPGPAGTAILFNTCGWHTSMINRTDRPRRSIILAYGVREAEVGTRTNGPSSPTS